MELRQLANLGGAVLLRARVVAALCGGWENPPEERASAAQVRCWVSLIAPELEDGEWESTRPSDDVV